jgi:hypothetical protein
MNEARKRFKSITAEPSNKIKLEVVANMVKKNYGISDDDLSIYLIDEVPLDLKKSVKLNDSSVILFENYVLDISNVDSVNARRVIPIVAVYKVLSGFAEELLEDSSYRLGLSQAIRELSATFEGKSIDLLYEFDIKEALLKAAENVFDVISDDIASGQSKLIKHQIGLQSTCRYEEVLIQYQQIVSEDSAKITLQETYIEKFDKSMYTEVINFESDYKRIVENEDKETIDEDCFYCRYCGDELVFLNETTAYCESCDKTMIVDRVMECEELVEEPDDDEEGD